jgi:hypothetical protein
VTVEWTGPEFLRRPAEALSLRIFHRPTRLTLNGPAYTDAAIEQLSRLTSLQSLTLERTGISEQGLTRLERALPGCRIERRSS